MALRFPYHLAASGQSVLPLGGRFVRPRPVIWLTLIGPTGNCWQRALVDTGADDTVFPLAVAARIGLDLSNAPLGTIRGAGHVSIPLRYAVVTLHVSDGSEQRQWDAWVGFTSMPMPYPVLGFSGFLQFFTATFRGDLEEVELAVNRLYAGT
jgi:Aspartyl protease